MGLDPFLRSLIYDNLIPRLCQAFGKIATKPSHPDIDAVPLPDSRQCHAIAHAPHSQINVAVRHQLIIGELHQLTNPVHRDSIKTAHVVVPLLRDRTWPVYGGNNMIVFTDNLWMPCPYFALANVMRSPKRWAAY